MSDQIKTDIPTNGHGPTDWKETLKGMPLSDEVIDAMIRAGAWAMKEELVELHPDEREPAFKAFTLKELMTRPPKEWLFKNLIGCHDRGMIFGDAGSGKTHVTIKLIMAAIAGRPFAGKFEATRPMKVAYCAGEGIDGIPARFGAAANHAQIWGTEAENNLHTFLDAPQLFEDDVDLTIYRFVEEWKMASRGPLDLLIIDTLHSATFGADENNARDAGAILKAVKYAVSELGSAVLFDHHTNRAGGYRGSSAFHGAMDMMIQTKHDRKSGLGTVEYFKLKDAGAFDTLYFKLRTESVSGGVYLEWLEATEVDLNKEPSAKDMAREAILELLKERNTLNQTDIVKQLAERVGRHTVLSALKDLETEGVLMAIVGPNNSKIYQLNLPMDPPENEELHL